MKRLATYVMALMLTGMVAFAEDVSSSITFSEQLNGGAMSPTLTLGDGAITLEFSQGRARLSHNTTPTGMLCAFTSTTRLE